MPRFRVHCFGPLAVLRDGAPLPPGAIQPRRLGLLAILAAAADRGVARDKVASLLWPDSDAEKSSRSVAQALYALRRDFGDEKSIEGVRDLRLNPEFFGSDLWDFATHRAAGSLEKAAECTIGPFLDGFSLPGLAEFDRWLEAERAAWAERYIDVVQRLARDADEKRDRVAAVRWWRRATAQDPHNARFTVQLMRALARSGDRAAALRQAEIYAALLQNDLELRPDPAVLNEAEAIRNAEEGRGITAEHAVPVAGVPARATDAPPIAHAAAADQPTAPSVASGDPGETMRSRRPVRAATARRAILFGTIALAAAVAVIVWQSTRAPATNTDVVSSRVLVVPPRNEGGDNTLDLVAVMAAEWITNGLSQTGLVDVIDSRTMLEATAGDAGPAAIRDFASGAGVGTLVVGTVFREHDSLRFDLKITEARTGRVIQPIEAVTVSASRPTAALEPLRQRVTGALAVHFDVRLPNQRAASSQPPTWESYQAFLLGMREFGSDYDAAIGHFRRAVALDSSYWQARLWTGIASANLRRYPEADSIFRSLDAAGNLLGPYDRATLDYFQLGFVNGNWEGSYRGAKRMVELAPGAGHALYALGTTAQLTNRPEEAIATLRRIDIERGWGTAWALRVLNLIARSQHALGRHQEELATARHMRATDETAGWARLHELRALAALGEAGELEQRVASAMTLPATTNTWEPFSPGDMLLQVARELRGHGDSARAKRYLSLAEEWYRSLPPAETATPGTQRELARVLYAAGRWREAGALFTELAVADSQNVEHVAGVALAAARLGDSATASRTLARFQAERGRWRFGAPALWGARIAAALGRREDAVALVRRAMSEGFVRIYQLHTDPDFVPMRAFPPFQELLRPRA